MRRGLGGGKTLSWGKDPRSKGQSQSSVCSIRMTTLRVTEQGLGRARGWLLSAQGHEERESLGTSSLSERDPSPEGQGIPWPDTHTG